MHIGRTRLCCWVLLGVATFAPSAATACMAQDAPAALSPGPEGTRFLSLLPGLLAHALEGTQTAADLAVDLESFQAGAVLFARATLSREQIAAAFGRPVQDVERTAVEAGEIAPGAVHLALEGVIDLGAYVEATATVSWSADRGRPAGQRTVRIVFTRTINGYRFHSVRTLAIT